MKIDIGEKIDGKWYIGYRDAQDRECGLFEAPDEATAKLIARAVQKGYSLAVAMIGEAIITPVEYVRKAKG